MSFSDALSTEGTSSGVLGPSASSSSFLESIPCTEAGQASASDLGSVSEVDVTTSPEVSVLLGKLVERYDGEMRGDEFHGEGVAKFPGGNVYKGSFSRGLMDGYGEYTWSDSLKYQGEFKANVPLGHGIYIWQNGSTYEGEIYHGLRHGVGTYTCAQTSTVYRGHWCLGKRHGKGAMYYNEAATSWYNGDWVNNRKEGWGTRRYRSGDVYEGQWKNNVQHGEGRMKWIHLDQEYRGEWRNGIQDGKGTHTWFRKRVPWPQYPRMNEYSGEFSQGMRHGRGQFFYASGAVYEGEWKHDKKHGEGRYMFESGWTHIGGFVKDSMTEFPPFTPGLSGLSTPFPDERLSPNSVSKSSTNSSFLGTDMVLNLQNLLNGTLELEKEQELKQVEFAVVRHIGLLREIYNFYSTLGREESSDKTFPLTQVQFSYLLKNCQVHQHGITLAQLDRLINDEVCSPFTTILPRECISNIIVAAYHIFYKDIQSSHVLAACFSRLMKQNIIPNAKNLNGLMFRYPDRAAVAWNYTERCWKIFQDLCRANSAHPDRTLSARHFVWFLQDLNFYDGDLTIAKVIEILDNLAICDRKRCNLEVEMSFLEFFEALLGCAELKGERKETPVLEELLPQEEPVYPVEMPHEEKTDQTQSPDLVPVEVNGEETTELEDWTQKANRFFTKFLFPAYENMKVTSAAENIIVKEPETSRTTEVEEKDHGMCP